MVLARRMALAFATSTLLGNVALAAPGNQVRPETSTGERRFCEQTLGGTVFARTELYFGLSRADGPNVTDAEFRQFLDTVGVHRQEARKRGTG